MKPVSSTPTGLSEASPITSADIAMRWSMRVATCRRPAPGPALHDQIIARYFAFYAVGPQPGRHRLQPVAFLDPQFFQTAMMEVPSAKLAATDRTVYSSIIEGARSGGTSMPRRFESRTRSLPSVRRHRPFFALFDFPAHFPQRLDQPDAAAIDHDVGSTSSEPRRSAPPRAQTPPMTVAGHCVPARRAVRAGR